MRSEVPDCIPAHASLCLQDPTSVFIFVTSGYLAVSPASQMSLVNGAQASNGERERSGS